MGLFQTQRSDDPVQWREQYSLGGAMLQGLSWELPGTLKAMLSVTRGPKHPALAGMEPSLLKALPRQSLDCTVHLLFSGVRGMRWIGRPKVLGDFRAGVGSFGRVETFDMRQVTINERSLWPDVTAPFSPTEAVLPLLWFGALVGSDFAMQWYCEQSSLREAA